LSPSNFISIKSEEKFKNPEKNEIHFKIHQISKMNHLSKPKITENLETECPEFHRDLSNLKTINENVIKSHNRTDPEFHRDLSNLKTINENVIQFNGKNESHIETETDFTPESTKCRRKKQRKLNKMNKFFEEERDFNNQIAFFKSYDSQNYTVKIPEISNYTPHKLGSKNAYPKNNGTLLKLNESYPYMNKEKINQSQIKETIRHEKLTNPNPCPKKGSIHHEKVIFTNPSHKYDANRHKNKIFEYSSKHDESICHEKMIHVNPLSIKGNLSQLNQNLKFNLCLEKLSLCIPKDRRKCPIEPEPPPDLKIRRKNLSSSFNRSINSPVRYLT
jgi:hypothetical protein